MFTNTGQLLMIGHLVVSFLHFIFYVFTNIKALKGSEKTPPNSHILYNCIILTQQASVRSTYSYLFFVCIEARKSILTSDRKGANIE